MHPAGVALGLNAALTCFQPEPKRPPPGSVAGTGRREDHSDQYGQLYVGEEATA